MWQFNFKQSTWDKIKKENHQKRRANVFKCKLECTSGYPWRSDTIRPCLQARVAAFGSQDLGFRTSINGHWVWLSGPEFQDLDKRALGFTLRTWVSRPRKLSILRSSYLFPVTFLCVHRHFSPASSLPVTFLCVHRPSVQAGSAIENASSCRPGRFCRRKRKQNAQSPTDGLSEFIYKILHRMHLSGCQNILKVELIVLH